MTNTDTRNAVTIATPMIAHSFIARALPPATNLTIFKRLAPNITGIAKKKVKENIEELVCKLGIDLPNEKE